MSTLWYIPPLPTHLLLPHTPQIHTCTYVTTYTYTCTLSLTHTHTHTHTGHDPSVGNFLAGRRQTIVGIPPTPEELLRLTQLAEQGVGGAEGGPDVDGSASRVGATPKVIVQNGSMHPQPLHQHPPRELEGMACKFLLLGRTVVLLSVWPPKVCVFIDMRRWLHWVL